MCFAPCSPEMVHNGSAAGVNPKDSLELRKEPNVEREKKWTCFSLASDSDVEQLYDTLSMRLNVDGKRRYLIVACVGSGHWGVLCKLDQERVVKLPDCISAAYDIKGSTRSGVASFCKSLFQGASALKANLKLRCEEANHGEQMEAHAKTQEMLGQIRDHVTQEINRATSALRAAVPGSMYPPDHATIRTDLERILTPGQLLDLHRAANLQPPTRQNANGKDVPAKVKYQLAQSLCTAAGKQRVIQGAQVFDYPTLDTWTHCLKAQVATSEWTPPVHETMTVPAVPLAGRKRPGGGAAAGSAGGAAEAQAWGKILF